MKVFWIVLCCIFAPIITYILLLIISSLFVNPKKEYTKNSKYYRWLLNSSTWLMIKILGIKIHVTGLENVPDGRFLIVSNHRSNFDPLLTWTILSDKDIAYISKEGNFHIPVFGRFIRKCCFLVIDRNNPRSALKTVSKAVDLIKNDQVSIGVYPEGTRSKNCVLLPFHAGIFMIAQKANVPILVMTITGTEQIHKHVPFRNTDVYMNFLTLMPASDIKQIQSTEISNQVRTIIENDLSR